MSAERINRRPIFFPIEDGVPVEAGAAIDVSMRILPADTMYAWEVRVAPPSGPAVTFRHTTLRGMLLAREDLERTNPAHSSGADARGRCAAGCSPPVRQPSHARARSNAASSRRIADLFASPAEAAMFVAEVVTRYGR